MRHAADSSDHAVLAHGTLSKEITLTSMDFVTIAPNAIAQTIPMTSPTAFEDTDQGVRDIRHSGNFDTERIDER